MRRKLRFEKFNTVLKVDLLTADSPRVTFTSESDFFLVWEKGSIRNSSPEKIQAP